MTTLLDILKKDSKGTFHWLEAANDFETALIPVYLTSMEDRHARERTLTENVSPHGARVISKRYWRPGEETLITLSAEGFAQVAKVIYCLLRAG
jgi:hypothetical protein